MRIVIASLVFSGRFCLNRWLAADVSNHALLYVCLMRDELAPLFGEPRQLPEPMGRILRTASLCKLGAGSSATTHWRPQTMPLLRLSIRLRGASSPHSSARMETSRGRLELPESRTLSRGPSGSF